MGVFLAGTVCEVEEGLATALIAGGYAESLQAPQPKPPSETIETAEARPTGEIADGPPRRGRPRKQR
jgi:hypothetical protein